MTTPSGPPVNTTLTCDDGSGGFTSCDLTLTQGGGFVIELMSTSCKAHGNTVALTKPTAATLMSDGCYEPSGKKWTYPGPYAAGTLISFSITSAQLPLPPALRASGSFPTWSIDFEDGGDTDLNDIVLQVTATP